MSTYSCDECGLRFDAERPDDTETNQDVACPACHRVETHLAVRTDSKPGKGRKERFG